MEVLKRQLKIYRSDSVKHKGILWTSEIRLSHRHKLNNGWNIYDIHSVITDIGEGDRLITNNNQVLHITGNMVKTKGLLNEIEVVRCEDSKDYSIARLERGIKTVHESTNVIVKKLLMKGIPTVIKHPENGLPIFHKNQIFGIEGCPGGGKSTKCSDIMHKFADKYKIFYFTPTHEQINNISKKLVERNLRFTIMSDESKLQNDLTKFHTSNQKEYDRRKKNSVLKTTNIVLSTTNKPLQNLNRIGPCIVIIDEAGRVSFLEAMTAISDLKHMKFLLLAGDTKQLGCHTTGHKHMLSVLEHIHTCPAHIWKVRGQYRFDSTLNYIISTAFYESEMSSLKRIGSQCALVVLENCEHTLESNSCAVEARICDEIANISSIEPTTIITPYKAQQLELRKLNRQSITIDMAQGCEYSRVILSLGRTKGKGFLTNRRINVGMSRARNTLIIVTHQKVISDIAILRMLHRVATINECLFSLRLNIEK